MRGSTRSILVGVAALLLLGVSTGAIGMAANPYPGPTPRAHCGPGSKPETGRQGRVTVDDQTSGRAAQGFSCNMQLLSHFGTKGGYKVERYVDSSGHECAYYDSTLLFPKDVGIGSGVYVLDMANPSAPVHTATLSTPAMQSPHESLLLNQKRGLLVAVAGTVAAGPGWVDIYDASGDCRNPVLQSSIPSGILGHESGMPPDGMTYYAASWYGNTITAIDISNPTVTHPLWVSSYGLMHGLSVSDDGNRAYLSVKPTSSLVPAPFTVTDTSGLVIIDVSQVQARVTNPQVNVVSTLAWPNRSTPQTTIPVTIGGHKFLVEIDEFGSGDKIGAARIIDIADDTKPFIVSNIRLDVNMPNNQADQVNDPGATTTFRGYEGHYCEVPRRNEPRVLACTFILSGLRLFDIQDPYKPKEIAYYNGPPTNAGPGAPSSTDPVDSFAMSKPAFVPERGEVWYTDGNSGFYALRLTNGVSPLLQPSRGPNSGSGSTVPNTGAGSPVTILGLVLALALAVALLTRTPSRRT